MHITTKKWFSHRKNAPLEGYMYSFIFELKNTANKSKMLHEPKRFSRNEQIFWLAINTQPQRV